MKKMVFLLVIVGLFVFTSFAVIQGEAQTPGKELRPSQVVMQQRAQWLKAMGENLTAKKLDAVKADATALAAQASAGAEKQTGLAKDLTLQLSGLAKAAADAAGAQNGDGVQMKLNEIKGVCGECHAKIRDKK